MRNGAKDKSPDGAREDPAQEADPAMEKAPAQDEKDPAPEDAAGTVKAPAAEAPGRSSPGLNTSAQPENAVAEAANGGGPTDAPGGLDAWQLALIALIGVGCGQVLDSIARSDGDDVRAGVTLGVAAIALSGGFFVAWARHRLFARLALTLGATFLLTALSWFILPPPEDGVSGVMHFSNGFWIAVGLPLTAYIVYALGLSALHTGAARPPYTVIFKAFLALPLLWAIGLAVGGALTGFIYLWSLALEAAGWAGLKDAIEDNHFALTLAGAGAGLVIALMRAAPRLREALASLVLICAKLALPLAASFGLVFIIAVMIGGVDSLRTAGSPTGILLALIIFAMLIANGVYRDGRDFPPAWVRIFFALTAFTTPLYAALALHGIWIRIVEYGFTPPRLVVAVIAPLAAAYAAMVLIAQLLQWLGRRKAVWLGVIAKFNPLFALLLAALLIGFATPLLSPDRISAGDQYARLMDGRVAAVDFDYEALRWEMGAPGRRLLHALAEIENHAEAEEIRTRARAQRDRRARWDDPDRATPPAGETGETIPADIRAALDELDREALSAAQALLEAEIERLDAAQALLCEIRRRDDITPSERLWLEQEIQRNQTYFIREAERRAAQLGGEEWEWRAAEPGELSPSPILCAPIPARDQRARQPQ